MFPLPSIIRGRLSVSKVFSPFVVEDGMSMRMDDSELRQSIDLVYSAALRQAIATELATDAATRLVAKLMVAVTVLVWQGVGAKVVRMVTKLAVGAPH
jgi:hypothetical protein